MRALLVLLVAGLGAALLTALAALWRLRERLSKQRSAAPPAAAGEPRQALWMEAFYPVDPVPRYGHGRAELASILAVLDAGVPRYRETLERFRPLLPELREIGREPQPARPQEPAWVNGFLPGLDALALYGFVATGRPPRYLEVGSGNSTKFAARAKRRHSETTEIISIDPHPRTEIDGLCDRVVRSPLETADLQEFRALSAGDILFFDGSHRVFQNSDVTVFFLEILPALPPGVLVQIHDICWPADYPPAWADRYYSEQYLAAMLLLFGRQHFEVVLPNAFVATHTDLSRQFDELWDAPHLQGIERHGLSLWLRTR